MTSILKPQADSAASVLRGHTVRGRRSPWVKLLLSLAVFILFLAAFELVAHVWVHFFLGRKHALHKQTASAAEVPWTVYDPSLGWKNKPGASVPRAFPSGDVRINDQGFRADRHYGVTPPGHRRVLAIGDSFTFGFGAGNGLDWPAQLECLDPALEVINLGVCAYDMGQIVLAYETAAERFPHDTVVLGFLNWDLNRSLNDYTATGFSRPLFRIRDGRLALTNVPVPSPKPPGSSVYGPLMIQRMVRTALVAHEVRLFINQPDRSQSWRLGRLLIRRLAESARRHGARLVVVDIPWFDSLKTRDAPWLSYGPRLFAEENIPYLDLHPVFRERLGLEHLFETPTGGHCSPAGYRLIAAQSLSLLRREGLARVP
jgi:hypothetical protein